MRVNSVIQRNRKIEIEYLSLNTRDRCNGQRKIAVSCARRSKAFTAEPLELSAR